ncbi:MAG TPA: methyltransferase domain-containing protein [Conexibacter sp.]|nr:methyltransferase domain-containing protein [Conexibacter sp.]
MEARAHVDSSEALAAKAAAVEQWTANPCGEVVAEGEIGTAPYFHSLLASRTRYAPWMEEELAYATARDRDVLDVGCGQGIDVARYAAAGARVSGVDLTPRHVELARAHLAAIDLDATIVQGDAEQLPFADGSFDRVSSNGVLHHTPGFDAALREVHRVLRPGGEARIVVYNRSSLHYWCNQVVRSGIIERALLEERSMAGVLSRNVEHSTIGARPLVRVYSPRQVRRALRTAGFQDVRTRVRHLDLDDAFPLAMLAARVPKLREHAVLDRIGRYAGWYVIGRGTRR